MRLSGRRRRILKQLLFLYAGTSMSHAATSTVNDPNRIAASERLAGRAHNAGDGHRDIARLAAEQLDNLLAVELHHAVGDGIAVVVTDGAGTRLSRDGGILGASADRCQAEPDGGGDRCRPRRSPGAAPRRQ